MQVYTQCPACRVAHTLPAFMRGKRVRCKQCKKTFVIDPDTRLGEPESPPPQAPGEKVVVAKVLDEPALNPPEKEKADAVPARLVPDPEQAVRAVPPAARPAAPPPRKLRTVIVDDAPSRRDDDLDEDAGEPLPRPPRRTPLLLLLGCGGLGLAAVLVLACGGVALFWWGSRTQHTAPVAQAIGPSREQHQPPPGPGPGRPPDRQPEKQPVAWNVAADPLRVPVKLTAEIKEPIPIPAGEEVLFPTTPSPFLSVGQNRTAADVRQVWNLETQRPAGTLRGPIPLAEPLALSPDGTTLAGKAVTGQAVEAWSFDTGAKVRRIDNVELVDFAAGGQLITAKLAAGGKLFQVWDLAGGRVLREFTGPLNFDAAGMALSPGRRYLAVVTWDKLLIYDVEAGKPAGEKELPKPDSGGPLPCEGLAFSPDGADLAGLFRAGLGLRLINFDLARGVVAANHAVPAVDGPGAAAGQTRPLQWLPDRSGWLVRGTVVVDARSGSRSLVELPAAAVDPGARRLLDPDHLLVVTGKPAARAVECVAFARKAMDPGAPVVLTPTAKQPKPKPADWSKVQTPAVGVAGPWSAQPDPVALREGSSLPPLRLQASAGDVQRVLFARPDTGRAAVLSASGRRVRLDLYDLPGGKNLGSVEDMATLPAGDAGLPVVDVSPDGTTVALRDPRDGRRLDVWSVPEGKDLAAWLPYEQQGAAGGNVSWVAFLDDQRLLTLDSAGQLVLWSLPACQAVYRLETLGRGPVALSPGRKYLALFTGETCDLLDAATGERRGRVVRPAGVDLTSCAALAFSPDGGELAALLQTAARTSDPTLLRWELKGGTTLSEFPVHATAGQLDWCGPRNMLLGNEYLLDLEHKAVVWHYRLPPAGRHATGSPDGRHWFTRAPSAQDPAYLAAQRLPTEAAGRRVTAFFAPTAKSLLKAGSKVDVGVKLTGVLFTEEETHRNELALALGNRLKGLGLSPESKQPVVLQLFAEERDTGDRMAVQHRVTFPFDQVESKQIPVKSLTCQVAYIHVPTAAVWWKADNVFTPGKPDRVLAEKEEPEAFVRKALWEQVKRWINEDLALPGQVVRSGADPTPLALPGESVLQGD